MEFSEDDSGSERTTDGSTKVGHIEFIISFMLDTFFEKVEENAGVVE